MLELLKKGKKESENKSAIYSNRMKTFYKIGKMRPIKPKDHVFTNRCAETSKELIN